MKPPGQVAYEAAAECANPFWLDCVDQHVEWDKLPELSREYWSKVAEAVLAWQKAQDAVQSIEPTATLATSPVGSNQAT